LQLPSWLADAPQATQTRWAQLYVSLRGVGLQLQGAPSDGYRRALAALLGRDVRDHDAVRATEVAVRVRADAVPLLDVVPQLPE
jgi:hypothetical protein